MTTSWTRFSRQNQPLVGILLMLLASACGAVDSVLVRQLAGEVHPFVMGFTRALFGLLVVLPWLLSRPGILQTEYRLRHVLRAALKLASVIAFFFAFAAAPLADVTAIAFASPIFVTLGAWVFLGERPRPVRILAVTLGFAGVLIVLRPDAGDIPLGLGYALIGALLVAVIQLILKGMVARDRTETLVAWNLIATVPLAAIPALLVWQTPTLSQWLLLALQGALGAAAMTLATRAFALADASLIVPFDFLRLPFVAALGYLFFGQVVTGTTWAGGIAIFVATLVMAHSARRIGGAP
ncbi:DMT family transporter [Salipiger sp. PrR002]|uniref:DMT family transporter n=1 Tax=Salipiger sp. PrR002 TaxID=2706489 RepID=UPI001F2CC368|nr:DMT family transporter [Salipiger sp. PrR002]